MVESNNSESSDTSDSVPLSPTERRCWGAFITVAIAVTRRLDRELQRDHDLTLDDLGVLAVLAESDNHQERFGELSARLRMPKANVTYRFQRLESQGLVERVSSPNDRRGAYAKLTPKGLSKWAQAGTDYLQFIRDHFLDHLDPANLNVVTAAMQAVVDAHPSGSEGLRP